MRELEGRVALVTGAARGQGRSHAMRLAEMGADIIGIDICEDIAGTGYPLAMRQELDDTISMVESQGRRMIGQKADVRDFTQVRKAVDGGVAVFGRLDIVCVNAGIAPMSFTRLSVEDQLDQWGNALAVNLTGAYYTARVTIPHIVSGGRGGSIIFTSSTGGLRGFGTDAAGVLGYSASKHGVVGLMRSLANHLAPHSIRVNSIHPTGVRTMMAVNPAMIEWLESHPEGGSHFDNPMPTEMLEPEDISDAVAFLASDKAKWITGVTLPVDVGFTNRV